MHEISSVDDLAWLYSPSVSYAGGAPNLSVNELACSDSTSGLRTCLPLGAAASIEMRVSGDASRIEIASSFPSLMRASGAIWNIPPKLRPLRDDEHQMRARAARHGFRRDVDVHPIELEELANRRGEIEQIAGDERNVLEIVEHGDVEAEARDVEEIPILDLPDVDHRLGALGHELCRGGEIARGRAY